MNTPIRLVTTPTRRYEVVLLPPEQRGPYGEDWGFVDHEWGGICRVPCERENPDGTYNLRVRRFITPERAEFALSIAYKIWGCVPMVGGDHPALEWPTWTFYASHVGEAE